MPPLEVSPMHSFSAAAESFTGGGILILGLLAYYLFKSYTGIEISTDSLALDVSQTAVVTATFKRKAWALGSWRIIPGSFNVRSFRLMNPVVTASPITETTSPTAPSLRVTVTALAPGFDTVRISGVAADDCAVETVDLSTSVLGH